MSQNDSTAAIATSTPTRDMAIESSASSKIEMPLAKIENADRVPKLHEKQDQSSMEGDKSDRIIAREAISTSNIPSVPSIYKRKFRRSPKGILKPAPPPTKAFSFKRDILQQLNTRLAQQGVNVQVPVPSGPTTLGSFGGTAQGTAQAASNLLGGVFRKMSGMVASQVDDNQTSITTSQGPASNHDDRLRSKSGVNVSFNQTEGASTSTRTNNLPAPSSSIRPLRRVRFPVSAMSVIYPISNALAPGDEDATRKRIEREHREMLKKKQSKDWTIAELEALYRDCCRMREEHPLKKMRAVFALAALQDPPSLRSLDLSFVPLDRQAIEPISDLLSINFGLNKLILENCGLTDEGVKSILNSLLASGNLPSLSLASNRKIKYHGWRYIGIFMRRAKALKYLDLSENNINKASLEHIAGAIANSPKQKKDKQAEEAFQKDARAVILEEDEEDAPLTFQSELLREESLDSISLTSLRLENCNLKSNSLEILAQSVRFSHLNHLSLRRNRITQIGAVALAIMLRDYPDSSMVGVSIPNGNGSEGSLDSSVGDMKNLSPMVPYVISSPGGGVTRRNLTSSGVISDASQSVFRATSNKKGDLSRLEADNSLTEEERQEIRYLRHNERRSEEDALALFHAKKAKRILSNLSRVGNLLTLDLKGNEIRGGVIYLSQALRKNRTLKVLNLSDNGIEVMGLVALADALKYNATLETLDLSHNPCCGPGLEGITTLRNAFTLNSNLKRLFISDSDLSSEGAIALAEFLPEARSLIHLDLTENMNIDIAGVMALAVSVRQNKSLRCLDLNIPPNAPDFARLSQEILNSCIRNTEIAQRKAQQRGVKAPIAAPIYKSTLAREAKEKEERNKLAEANNLLEQASRSGADDAREMEKNQERIVDAASECCKVLKELLGREEEKKTELIKERSNTLQVLPQSDLSADLLKQGRVLRDKLQMALGIIPEGNRLTRALQVNEDLESVISNLNTLYKTNITGHESNFERQRNPDSVMISPSLSIDSGEFEQADQEEPVSDSVSRLKNLALDIKDPEGPQAAREIPADDEEISKKGEEIDEVIEKARGQLSEEGEIFRRAKSLHIDEDEEVVADDSEGKIISPILAQNRDERVSAEKTGIISSSFSRSRLESGSRRFEDGVSGEELRRELLETDIPRSPLSKTTLLVDKQDDEANMSRINSHITND